MTNRNTHFWPGRETVRLIGRGSFGAVYEIQRDVFGDLEKAALAGLISSKLFAPSAPSLEKVKADVYKILFVNGISAKEYSINDSDIRSSREVDGSVSVIYNIPCYVHKNNITATCIVRMRYIFVNNDWICVERHFTDSSLF